MVGRAPARRVGGGGVRRTYGVTSAAVVEQRRDTSVIVAPRSNLKRLIELRVRIRVGEQRLQEREVAALRRGVDGGVGRRAP
jgi:hypothetical protein